MRMSRVVAGLFATVATIAPLHAVDAQDQPTSPLPSPSTTQASTPAVDVDVQQDIPYYDGGPVLDAYLPRDGQTDRPALVLVHGGGWNRGDDAELTPYANDAAANQHWAVFDVDYLLSATDVRSWPDELHDVQAAIRFIATNSQNFGIDPQKVVALGDSAGANLLALISSEGTANPVTGDPVGDDTTLAVPVRAVALWSPPVDLADVYANGGQAPNTCGTDEGCDFVSSQGAIAEYMHCDPAACPQSYADASPTTWVTANTAPTFVVSSSDELIPLGQVVQYVAKLQANQVPVQFVQLPGTLHGIEYADQVWPQSVAFLSQELAPPAPPPSVDTTAGPTTSAEALPAGSAPGSGTATWPIVALVAAGVVVVAGLVVHRLRVVAKERDTIDLTD